ncbi:MAG: hypothetical protein ACO1OB_18985 [Archangium sp.]
MEGRVETIEDALLLLDAVARAVSRGVEEDDDINTVREAISQLPRLDEHAEKLATVPDAEPLVRRYTQLKKDLEKQLGAPSLRAGLTKLIERRIDVARPPTASDTILMDSPTMSRWFRGLVSAAATIVAIPFNPTPLTLVLFPVVWLVVNLIYPRDRWFSVEPHRIFMSGRLNFAVRAVKWTEPLKIERHDDFFIIKARLTSVPLSPGDTELFASWLALLTGPWLNALSPKKQNVVTLKAREDARGDDGAVFVTSEGVLFLPETSKDLVARALTDTTLKTLPPWNKLVDALSHARNWSALGPHLATKCDGAWLERGSFTIEEADPTSVRLNGSTRANEETTGNRGRWSLVQLTLEPFKRTAALALLEETKSQAT